MNKRVTFAKTAVKLPDGAYRKLRSSLYNKEKIGIASYCDLMRYSNGRIPADKISSFKNVRSITDGLYDYEYLNICFINNMLSIVLKSLCEGYIPRIDIIAKGNNLWEQFFKQPFEGLTEDKPVEIYNEKMVEAFPSWECIYQEDQVDFWGALYNDFLVFNDKTNDYIQDELKTIIGDRRVLGVLCRGTDYILKKPKNHPVQPELNEIIAKAREVFDEGGYEYMYLATEDSKFDEAFREEFGDKMLVNKRIYYDKIFDSQKLELIKDVHFERENDEYLKGIEYLSSLYILANCKALVAGNCGGTQAAVFLNRNKYEKKVIFDLGLYE